MIINKNTFHVIQIDIVKIKIKIITIIKLKIHKYLQHKKIYTYIQTYYQHMKF